MKILAAIFLFSLFISGLSSAQERDTTKIQPPLNSKLYYYLSDDFDIFFPRTDFNKFSVDSNNVRLLSLYLLSEQFKENLWNVKGENYMLSNYHDFYIENSKFNMVRYVLGMVQFGAVGYFAYKSIKRFGLWDNKN